MPEQAEAQVYVGIDVSKDFLDVYLHPLNSAFRVANTKCGWRHLKRRLKAGDVALIVMEPTGKYHRALHRSLADEAWPVALVSPLRARRFAEALGRLAKNDRIDAAMLARMAAALSPKVTPPSDKALQGIEELVLLRAGLQADRSAAANRARSAEDTFVKHECQAIHADLGRRIKRLEAEIMARIGADPDLERRYRIYISIPSVGKVGAFTLVALMPELGTLTSKEVAALVGVAPFVRESGTYKGQCRIRGGRAAVRRTLYMAAVSAGPRASNPQMKRFYDRLIGAGKKAPVALTAVIRKLAILANTLVRQNREWQPTPP